MLLSARPLWLAFLVAATVVSSCSDQGVDQWSEPDRSEFCSTYARLESGELPLGRDVGRRLLASSPPELAPALELELRGFDEDVPSADLAEADREIRSFVDENC